MTLNIPEVLVANGAGSVMVLFLLLFRVHNYDSEHTSERLFDGILISTLVALIAETVSFLIDSKEFPGSVFLLYLSNTLCTGLTVLVGFLWCGFVNFHIYRSKRHLLRRIVALSVPLAVVYVLLIINLFGSGIIFQIEEGGVYVRGALNGIVYLALLLYFMESIAEVYVSKRRGVNVLFFPVYYFIIPCLVGTVIQGLCYGLATGWLSTATACTLVSIELETSSSFQDNTSGLFNRKYMNYYLNRAAHSGAALYGIMMDINEFKSINDRFGHTVGDNAISQMGKILTRSIISNAIPLRMSGDEFVILINNGSEQKLEAQRQRIESELASFNSSGAAPYQLTVSIGTASLPGKTVEQFLTEMDHTMYKAKRAYHQEAQN